MIHSSTPEQNTAVGPAANSREVEGNGEARQDSAERMIVSQEEKEQVEAQEKALEESTARRKKVK